MFLKPGQIRDAVNYFGRFWIIFSVVFIIVNGQEGNGCGHTVMGTESGTLASQNYPGTYPVDSWCKWRLRVPKGRTLRLLFGDFDVERSPGCRNGSLTITSNNGAPSLGRGFLFSYTTDQHSGLISCRQRGTHFISQQFSVYCPAGCKDVTGDICGHSEQGYRDTSVLCKAAVHAGVVSDNVGGQITVTRGRSLTLYESSFANGILSKMGSLSENKLVFSKEVNKLGQLVLWSPKNMDAEGQLLPWASDGSDREPWLELELTDKGSVTGIITRGSADFYIESYVLLFSKDRRNWKVYKAALSREKKVFEAHSDGHLRVLNSLFPPVVVRYLRLQPQSWQGRASAHVQVLGCPLPKIHPRPRSAGGSPSLKVDVSTTPLPNPVPTEDPVIIKDSSLSSNQPVIVVVGVILGLILCVSCLLAGVWWNRRKKPAHMKKYSLPKVASQSFQGKSPPCSDSELISYPLERGVHDALPNPPLNANSYAIQHKQIRCLIQHCSIRLPQLSGPSFPSSPPGFTPKLRALKQTGRLECLSRKSGLTVHTKAYKLPLSTSRDALSAARSAYFSNIINSSNKNSRTLFSTVSKLLQPRDDTFSTPSTELCNSFL
ncbi:unnamed protein product, partial [Coregonus sp. 'balchen']